MGIRSVGRFFLFIAGGIAVIIVGFFMLRGNMRMWDRSKSDAGGDDNDGDAAADDDYGGDSGGGVGDGSGKSIG